MYAQDLPSAPVDSEEGRITEVKSNLLYLPFHLTFRLTHVRAAGRAGAGSESFRLNVSKQSLLRHFAFSSSLLVPFGSVFGDRLCFLPYISFVGNYTTWTLEPSVP